MEGRINWLKELWESIHYFGCAVDPTKDSIGNAASGISLEFQYSLLDLKANNMITEAEPALVEYFWFITEDFNRQNNTNYDADLVSIQFNKSRVTNNLETVTMITQSADLLPDKLLLQAHPLVKDADQAYKDLLAEREEKLSRQREMFGAFGEHSRDNDE
jgi:SPP1 family phage portal protein